MNILWSVCACQDLASIRAQKSLDASAKELKQMAKQMLGQIEGLREYPGGDQPGLLPGTRQLEVLGRTASVVYRVQKDVIEILRVFHSDVAGPICAGVIDLGPPLQEAMVDDGQESRVN